MRPFTLPEGRIAVVPIEASGGPRDEALMLVADRGSGELTDTRLRDLDRFLDPGDLLVVNDSAVVPARLRSDQGLLVHLSTRQAPTRFVVELRLPCGAGSLPFHDAAKGLRLELPARGRLDLLAPAGPGPAGGTRLWHARLRVDGGLLGYLAAHGDPIRYGCADAAWPLDTYQTVFARRAGSAESPSAGRGFTPRLLSRLRGRGVALARVTLHCGVSSQGPGEPPFPEWRRVPARTAAAVAETRARGGRVVAVGTTVVRALESAVGADGRLRPAIGFTDHVVSPTAGVRAVDGILSGWHEAEASHLDLLEAIAGTELLERSYDAALAGSYRWHELGDLHLILGGRPRQRPDR